MFFDVFFGVLCALTVFSLVRKYYSHRRLALAFKMLLLLGWVLVCVWFVAGTKGFYSHPIVAAVVVIYTFVFGALEFFVNTKPRS